MTSPDSKSNKLSLSGIFLIASIGVALIWGVYVMESCFGISLKGKKITPGDELVPFWMALALTPVIYVGSWIYYRREVAFLSRAVPMTGHVVSVGTIAMHQMCDITYSYTFGTSPAVAYKNKQSVPSKWLSNVSQGDVVNILVDPLNPGKSRFNPEL